MQKKKTIHLLILDPSQNDAEKIISLLRNAGHATRAHRVTSEEDLLETLGAGAWDLFLAREIEQELGPAQALAQINRLDKDIPFLLLTRARDPDQWLEFLKLGAKDVVPFDASEILLQVIRRELAALNERRRRRSLEGHLRDSEQRCNLLLESSRDAIAYINDGMHVYANQSYLEFLGYDDLDEMICIPILDTLSTETQTVFRERTKAFLEGNTDQNRLQGVARRSDDSQVDIVMELSPATFDGEPCIQVVVSPEQDNAELEEKLRQISSQDLLTGLYNRQHLMEQLSSAIVRAHETGQMGVLAYIDLDNFVQIKNQAGIAGADLVLGDVANLLRENAPEGAVLARLTDDSFAILNFPGDEKQVAEACGLLCKAIENHLFEVSGRTVQITASIGIAPIAENSPKAQDLLGRAHTASSDVRKLPGHENGNGVLVYNPANYEKLDESSSVAAIQRALDDDRFRLLFQPIINLRGEGEEHYEAFLRMLDKEGEEVSPYDFLPPAGPSDMANKIDRWVVLQTIKHLSSHRSRGHDTRLFLNLTAETIQDKTFTSWLSVALKAARLPGDSLIFQVAEGDATTHLKQAKEFSKALKELHCKLSISRFGCALNPFNTLKHVEADYVKLDGSFTEEIQKSDEAKESIKEMIRSLQNTGKLTIVPLVENASVLSTLWQAGVNYIQGYYLQAPVPEMNYDFGEH